MGPNNWWLKSTAQQARNRKVKNTLHGCWRHRATKCCRIKGRTDASTGSSTRDASGRRGTHRKRTMATAYRKRVRANQNCCVVSMS